jgi:hypothetical protein
MLFEILILLLTLWSGFDHLMIVSLRFARTLHRNGITFFIVKWLHCYSVKHIPTNIWSGSHYLACCQSFSGYYRQTKLSGPCSLVCSWAILSLQCWTWILGLYWSFVWSMTTLVLNRSLLHVRCVEAIEAFMTEWLLSGLPETNHQTVSPFRLPKYLDDWKLEEEL